MVASISSEPLRLYSISELRTLPEPEWQIEKLFHTTSRVVIYGESGSGKSFLALDFALCIATGHDWNGRRVRQAAVIYVAAEGGRSICKRVDAWMAHHSIEAIDNVFFFLEGVQIRESTHVEHLLNAIQARNVQPALIVLDTLARCFVGSDENSAKDMGEFIEGVERLLRQTGATVMILHHSGKSLQRERGSTALRGAVDVMINVAKDDDTITLTNDKQKDDEQFEDIELELTQVSIGSDRSGGGMTSCVLVPVNSTNKRGAKSARLPSHLRGTLKALADLHDGTASRAEWLQAVAGRLETRTLDEHAKQLVKGGWAAKVQRGSYAVTDKGRATLRTGARSLVQTAASATNLQLMKACKSPNPAASAATP